LAGGQYTEKAVEMQTYLTQRGYETQRRTGPFIRYFDKTPKGILCPHFWHLAWANGCPYRCAYCYLQGTFRGRVNPVVYINSGDLTKEVETWLSMETPQILNTGELTDSLAITDELMVELLQRFARQRRHKLLLLTKSDNVENLLPLEHNNQTIISFSLNIPEVIERYEVGSPNLERRLKALTCVAEAGYEVRVRIDPMIPVEGWSIAYRKLAEKLRGLPISRVTLGTLRYFPIVAKYAVKLGRGIEVFNFATERTVEGRIRPIESLRRDMYLNIFTSFNCSVALCKETTAVYTALKPSARCNCVL
jgi:spore photoproduct lyase